MEGPVEGVGLLAHLEVALQVHHPRVCGNEGLDVGAQEFSDAGRGSQIGHGVLLQRCLRTEKCGSSAASSAWSAGIASATAGAPVLTRSRRSGKRSPGASDAYCPAGRRTPGTTARLGSSTVSSAGFKLIPFFLEGRCSKPLATGNGTARRSGSAGRRRRSSGGSAAARQHPGRLGVRLETFCWRCSASET